MTQQKRPNKPHIKITQIPLSIQLSSTIGIINFLSQNNATVLQKPIINVEPHNQQITFKNAIGKGSESQQSDEQFLRKKIIPKNRIIIKPQNIKRKYFKIDIPINKGTAGGMKNYREKSHFIIQFNNDNKGTLTVVDDIYDSQIEIVNSMNNNNQGQLSFQEKMKLQDAKLDARRREERIQVMEEKRDGRKREK